MATLSAAERDKLPAKDFAGPDGSYPVPDKSHAQNALARASQQKNAGNLTAAEYAKIKARAKAKLKSLGGGDTDKDGDTKAKDTDKDGM